MGTLQEDRALLEGLLDLHHLQREAPGLASSWQGMERGMPGAGLQLQAECRAQVLQPWPKERCLQDAVLSMATAGLAAEPFGAARSSADMNMYEGGQPMAPAAASLHHELLLTFRLRHDDGFPTLPPLQTQTSV